MFQYEHTLNEKELKDRCEGATERNQGCSAGDAGLAGEKVTGRTATSEVDSLCGTLYDRARCLKHASKSFAWTSSGIPWASWRSACKTEVSSRRAHVTWCWGRLDPNPRKCIQGPEFSNAKEPIGPTTLVKQWNKSCSAGCSPHR